MRSTNGGKVGRMVRKSQQRRNPAGYAVEMTMCLTCIGAVWSNHSVPSRKAARFRSFFVGSRDTLTGPSLFSLLLFSSFNLLRRRRDTSAIPSEIHLRRGDRWTTLGGLKTTTPRPERHKSWRIYPFQPNWHMLYRLHNSTSNQRPFGAQLGTSGSTDEVPSAIRGSVLTFLRKRYFMRQRPLA
jgi:hypothetical protein